MIGLLFLAALMLYAGWRRAIYPAKRKEYENEETFKKDYFNRMRFCIDIKQRYDLAYGVEQ